MNREKNVISYYVLSNKLKNVIRKGWIYWKVERNRIESVAEHVYGVLQLAIAMYSEYEYDLNILKVLFMLSVHELEETILGDLTHFEIDEKEKEDIGHKAIEKLLSPLLKGEEIKELIYEFDERKTQEAIFAYHCDKLECDLQCKIYDEENCVDMNNQGDNKIYYDDKVQDLLSKESSWSGMWLEYDKPRFVSDENFLKVLEYAKNNKIN